MIAGCALCHQVAGRREGDLLHEHLGGAYQRRIALENDNAVVFPSVGPLAFGHVLVSPVRHARSIAECDDTELAAINCLADMVAEAIGGWTSQPVHRFEHGNASGEDRVACSVEHAHLHLLPAGVDISRVLSSLGNWTRLDAIQSPLTVSRGREYLLSSPA